MELLLWLQSIRTPGMDAFFSAITHLGDEMLVVLVVAVILWCVDRRFALRMGLVFFLGGVLCQIIKIAVMMPRPWMLCGDLTPVAAAIAGADGWSLPSGHTMSAVTLYGMLLTRVKPWLKALCALVIALVAFSRLYLGVHTPLDVGISLLLGSLFVFAGWKWMGSIERSKKAKRAFVGVAMVMTAALLILSLSRYFQGYDYDLLDGGFVGVGASIGFLLAWWRTGDMRYREGAPILQQILKMLMGLVLVALLLWGLPALVGENPVSTAISYFLVTLWAVAVYPTLIMWRMNGRGKNIGTER